MTIALMETTMRKLLALLIPGLLLTACAQQSVGMANPASVYCKEKGGSLTIKTTDKGQIGICQLPDGTQIEEWELYRRDHPQAL